MLGIKHRLGLGALGIAAVALTVAPSVSKAQIVDPQIYVCQSCTSPSGGLLIGGEGNPITDPTGFNIGVESGNHTLMNPLLVIVGVFNGTAATATPELSFGAITNEPLATVPTYGSTSSKTNFTATTGGGGNFTAYDALGLASGGSVTFSNLASIDSQNSLGTPTSFELFAFALDISLTSQNSPITIDTNAPNGSFVIGYSCESTVNGTTSTACNPAGAIGQTPLTNVGIVDGRVPEPASLAIFGTALAGMGLLGRRRRKNV